MVVNQNQNRQKNNKENQRSVMAKGVRILALFLLLLLFLPAFGKERACASETETEAKGTGSLAKKLTLVQYQTKKLKIGEASGKVTWSSSKPSVAKVTKKGKVTAVAPGKCKIRAKCNGKTYTCKLTVQALALSSRQVTLVRRRSVTLTLNNTKVKPEWTSSDPSVAAVTSKGYVQAKKPGKCQVTAIYQDSLLTCDVTVLATTPENLKEAYPLGKTNRKKIVLAGSSSMDFWDDAPADFAPYEVINMAIAGTTAVQWLSWYNRMIVKYKPCAVVIYVGSNDLANGGNVSGEENAANTIRLLQLLHKKLKNVPIWYLSVNPCWARQGAWDDILVSNRKVRAFCKKTNNLFYIDISSAFEALDGTPDKSLFLSDQLHPNKKGYLIWKNLVAKKVIKKLNALKGDTK